jgi:hypothetical protein
MKIKKVLDTVLFKTCIVRKEIVALDDNDPGTEWKAAYSLIDGSYIGSCKDAEYFEEKGIMPQAIPGNHVASIGFCKEEQKWYGWSHRAVFGFGIGSKVKKGDCAYKPTDPQDMLDDMIRFWVDDENESVTADVITKQEMDVEDPHGDRDGVGILLEVERIRKKDNKLLTSTHWNPYPDKWARGEWEAKTIDDAKQMAIDFARSVS